MTNDQTIDGTAITNTTRDVRIMFAGSCCFGVFADEIEAIADWRKPAPLPDAPAGVLGVASIRGRMLTVLEAAMLFGPAPAAAPGKIVALRGEEQVALAVSSTGDLIEIASGELGAAGGNGALILGVISRGEQSIAVLDSKQLFAQAMRGRERRRRHF
jgi:chemotaxis signal transduction protein